MLHVEFPSKKNLGHNYFQLCLGLFLPREAETKLMYFFFETFIVTLSKLIRCIEKLLQ